MVFAPKLLEKNQELYQVPYNTLRAQKAHSRT